MDSPEHHRLHVVVGLPFISHFVDTLTARARDGDDQMDGIVDEL